LYHVIDSGKPRTERAPSSDGSFTVLAPPSIIREFAEERDDFQNDEDISIGSRSSNVKSSSQVSQSSILYSLFGYRSSKGNASMSMWVDFQTFDSFPPGGNVMALENDHL